MSRISLLNQTGALNSYFPNSDIRRKGESEMTWIHWLKPTPLSNSYRVKIHYVRAKSIKISVLNPERLPLAPGKEKLPHVYSTLRQELCLYYPEGNEWETSMYYVHTLVPWASEWLFHYEIWVGTGQWNGGGIEHEDKV